jgi:hypothetical protein
MARQGQREEDWLMLLPNLVVVEDIVDKFAWNWLLSEPDSGCVRWLLASQLQT